MDDNGKGWSSDDCGQLKAEQNGEEGRKDIFIRQYDNIQMIQYILIRHKEY